MPQSITPEPGNPGSQPIRYSPGHHMHFIHAGRIAATPWGWRDGVVRSSDDAGHHVIDYALEPGHIEVWSEFCPQLQPGTPVRVHERYWAMDVAGNWFNVRKDSPGLGPVPEPDDLTPWIGSPRVVAVSNAEGVGLGPEPHRERPDAD